MNAKTYLGQAHRMNLKINSKFEQLEQLRTMAYKVTSTLNDNKVSSTKQKSPMENAVIKIVMAENDINMAISQYLDYTAELREKIAIVKNEEYRILLELRYLCFNTWEQIAVKMNYSCSYVYKQHCYAIKSFEIVIKREVGKNNE